MTDHSALRALCETAKGPYGSVWESDMILFQRDATPDVVLDLLDTINQQQYSLSALEDENKALREACTSYDNTLLAAFPHDTQGEAWNHWNDARIALNTAGILKGKE